MRPFLTIALSVGLVVTAGAQAAEPSNPSTAAAPGDKMICKRFTRTGTLVAMYKTCKTKRDWDREHANIMAPGQSGYCGPRDTAQGMNGTTC